MGIFTKEEKMDMKTGKWVTTQKGIIDRKETPVYDKLKPQIKAAQTKQRMIRKQKRAAQIKAFNKRRIAIAKRLSTVSFDEPKQQQHKKKHHKKYKKTHAQSMNEYLNNIL